MLPKAVLDLIKYFFLGRLLIEDTAISEFIKMMMIIDLYHLLVVSISNYTLFSSYLIPLYWAYPYIYLYPFILIYICAGL